MPLDDDARLLRALRDEGVRRVDLVARSLSALIEQDDSIDEVSAWVRPFDEKPSWKMTAWRCENCERTHIDIDKPGPSFRWDREKADERLYREVGG